MASDKRTSEGASNGPTITPPVWELTARFDRWESLLVWMDGQGWAEDWPMPEHRDVFKEAAALLRDYKAALEREIELTMDLGGRSFEAAIIGQVDHIRDAMREGNAPDALKNLAAGMATCAARAVAYARWAAMEAKHVEAVDAESERLRAALREIDKPPSGTWRDLFERARRIASEALNG